MAEENSRAGDPRWRLGARVADEATLGGWVDHASVLAGDPLTLYVHSTLGAVEVTAYRLGHYDGAGARALWQAPRPIPASSQPPPVVDGDRMARCRWRDGIPLETAGWPPGTYVVRLRAAGRVHFVPLTIRSPSVAGKLVLVNATATYQAYNVWGGHCLYFDRATRHFEQRALRVSMDRPGDTSGARTLLLYEIAPIAAAERLGLDLAYLTSGDLDAGAGVLDGAAGVVSLGHDEYWSLGMRAAVESARDGGTNLVFMGANVMYWRIRFADNGRTVVCYKDSGLDPKGRTRTTTAKWRDDPYAAPEHLVTGQLYEAFPVQGAFVVHDPRFFGFAGLEVRTGSSVAGLCGTEVDRAYPIAGTPETLRVVGHSPVAGSQLRTYCDLTYYSTASGAGVVAFGSMLWSVAMRGAYPRYGIPESSSRFAIAVAENVLREAAIPRLGARRPAVANLHQIRASASTRTGSGGPLGSFG